MTQIIIDTESKKVDIIKSNEKQSLDLYSKESFEMLSDLWLKMSWNQKYSYTFTWLGRPIIQHPEDMIRLQEAIYTLKPDVIVETGIAHGGSLIFNASLLKCMGKGKVIGVDIEIRPHNKKAIISHELSSMIHLIEGDSVSPEIISQVKKLINPTDKVLVILDSNHCKNHVAKELEAYYKLVTPGSYIVVTDGLMQDLCDVPSGKPEWENDNPVAATEEFLAQHSDFTLETPAWTFNESALTENITAWPSAWVKRREDLQVKKCA